MTSPLWVYAIGFVGMALYDGVLLMGASVLFDYLWYEE